MFFYRFCKDAFLPYKLALPVVSSVRSKMINATCHYIPFGVRSGMCYQVISTHLLTACMSTSGHCSPSALILLRLKTDCCNVFAPTAYYYYCPQFFLFKLTFFTRALAPRKNKLILPVGIFVSLM